VISENVLCGLCLLAIQRVLEDAGVILLDLGEHRDGGVDSFRSDIDRYSATAAARRWLKAHRGDLAAQLYTEQRSCHSKCDRIHRYN
jgi:hypothetical protein